MGVDVDADADANAGADVTVREADPSDAESIRAVHARSIRELGREAYDERQVEAWAAGCESADYAAAVAAEGVVSLVAERGGAVVAFGSLRFGVPEDGAGPDADAEVTAVYVDPSVAREGVGSAVYAALERRARAAGVESLRLVASANAVPFYEAHGYVRVGTRAHEFSARESTGVSGTVVEMRKPL
jgi:putative acetyltransferase